MVRTSFLAGFPSRMTYLGDNEAIYFARDILGVQVVLPGVPGEPQVKRNAGSASLSLSNFSAATRYSVEKACALYSIVGVFEPCWLQNSRRKRVRGE